MLAGVKDASHVAGTEGHPLLLGLADPRVDQTKKLRLDDILVIALCAVVSGADRFGVE
ncbi:MAG: transposase family protein [Acidobacteria bacterium]|nr:transposase family protein [Acidobacteriota bacterium]